MSYVGRHWPNADGRQRHARNGYFRVCRWPTSDPEAQMGHGCRCINAHTSQDHHHDQATHQSLQMTVSGPMWVKLCLLWRHSKSYGPNFAYSRCSRTSNVALAHQQLKQLVTPLTMDSRLGSRRISKSTSCPLTIPAALVERLDLRFISAGRHQLTDWLSCSVANCYWFSVVDLMLLMCYFWSFLHFQLHCYWNVCGDCMCYNEL